MEKRYYFQKIALALLALLLLTACHREEVVPVEMDVTLHIKDDNHTSPLFVSIENRTRNATNFLWTFEGGEPATSSLKNPGPVLFTAPGEHTVTLEAWNEGDRSIKTYPVRVDSTVVIDFETIAEINNYAPAVFRINNLSSGGSTYRWTFEGGSPEAYEGQHPPSITYDREGNYTIELTVENGSAVFTRQKEITVGESLEASFTIVPSFEDEDDGEAPLRATFTTHLQGVETLRWECAGATIANETSPEASIYFPSEGEYTVYLEVSNGKETKRASQKISVKPNTNLRTHKDIRLGINTAQALYPVYYSTKLRRPFAFPEINNSNGAQVDIVFFGLSDNFRYNRFVSPDRLQETTLREIPNAAFTRFINRTEAGDLSLTPEQFEVMTTDVLLRDLAIWEAAYGDESFTNDPLPRVVLFETADRRKGAILIKEMVSGGADNSYIIIDIKVQKND
jgi:PKD repeat protein